MNTALKIPVRMSVAEFLAWTPPTQEFWQLVDGVPQAMAPANHTHGAIQGELARIIANHLIEQARPCHIVVAPGVIPRVQSETNIRIPDLAVTCSGYAAEESILADPVLVIEILSPSNQAETWANVWTYTTIPSILEIVIVKTASIGAEIIHRNADGSWPDRPSSIGAGDELTLESIGMSFPVAIAYRTTRLAAAN